VSRTRIVAAASDGRRNPISTLETNFGIYRQEIAKITDQGKPNFYPAHKATPKASYWPLAFTPADFALRFR